MRKILELKAKRKQDKINCEVKIHTKRNLKCKIKSYALKRKTNHAKTSIKTGKTINSRLKQHK